MNEFYPIKETEVNEFGNNKNIKFHVVDKDIMESCGFKKLKDGTWCFCKGITHRISFNVTIKKDDNGYIDILDNDWLQPYDFQAFIMNGNPNEVAIKVQKEVYQWMDSFKTFGIIEYWEWGDYI